MALASVVKKLGRMIRKTLYLCVGVVAAALMSINACSSNVQANTNESELERIADHSVNIAYSMSDEDEDEMLAAENEALATNN